MKIFRYLLLLVSFCALSGMAKADQADFHMVVLDPPFTVYPIFSTPFSPIVFTDCTGQLPTNVKQSYEGCFSGVNRTGNDWFGVDLVFDNTTPLSGQPVNCTPDQDNQGNLGPNFYTSSTCALSGSQYVLSYTGGIIHNNDFFVIAEDGVSPDQFPNGTLTADIVPEPGSIWLLSTGLSAAGAVVARRRALRK